MDNSFQPRVGTSYLVVAIIILFYLCVLLKAIGNS